MTRKIAALATACAAALGSASCLAAAALATNALFTGSMAPVMAKDFKEANGWSSGDYFGPRSGRLIQHLQIADNFKERNGYSSGDYFGPKG